MPTLAPPPVPAVHPERDALLAAIRDDPDSDLPRLVYADWQDDHGQPEHAELIRVQCEIGRLRKRADTPLRQALRARANALLRTPALRPMRPWWPDLASIDRGLTDAILFHSPDVTQAVPPLDKVLELEVHNDRDTPAGWLAEAAAEPWFGRVHVLCLLDSPIGPGDLRRVAGSPHLGWLVDVAFAEDGSVDAGELTRLALAPAATGLSRLLVRDDCRVTSGPHRRLDKAAFAAALGRVGRTRRAKQFRLLYIDSPDESDALGLALVGADRLRRTGRAEAVAAPVRQARPDGPPRAVRRTPSVAPVLTRLPPGAVTNSPPAGGRGSARRPWPAPSRPERPPAGPAPG